jgi:two-component system sensor histidine kinase QseC
VLGLPVLALLTRWAVRKGLEPLSETTQRIDSRAPGETGPLDAHDAPEEVAPLVGAINGLLQRLGRVLDNERQFTANAAHELRTPLAGALIHVENALATQDTGERQSALVETRSALDRMTRLVNQMLELARWDAASAARTLVEVDLIEIVDDELAEFAIAAARKNIEIVRSYATFVPRVRGWEAGLRVLVRNLLDNAIRYGASSGTLLIDVRPDTDGVMLAVEDDGPGISALDRDAMFGRFQRGEAPPSEGAGLGLPIAKRIADLHRASLRLLNATSSRGLRVEVRFPRSM